MNIRLEQSIMVKKNLAVSETLIKDISSDFVPRKGDWIFDDAFPVHGMHEVDSIKIDYDQNLCTVQLSRISFPEDKLDRQVELVENYKRHCWETLKV